MLASPDEMPEAFAAAWAARDAGALAALFAEDADFVNVVGIWWETRTAIETAHAYGLGTFFRDSRLGVGRVKCRMLGPGAAVVHARFHLTGQTGRDGSAAGARHTLAMFVMERVAGGWLCVAAQNGEILHGAETFEATDAGPVPRDYR